MPGTFCYLNPVTGGIHEEIFPCGTAPEKITLEDGTVCERNREAEYNGIGIQAALAGIMVSNAMGVTMKSQQKEYIEFAKKHGCKIDFDNRGRMLYDKANRKRYCELVGATDLDGGYNDPFCG